MINYDGVTREGLENIARAIIIAISPVTIIIPSILLLYNLLLL